MREARAALAHGLDSVEPCVIQGLVENEQSHKLCRLLGHQGHDALDLEDAQDSLQVIRRKALTNASKAIQHGFEAGYAGVLEALLDVVDADGVRVA